MIDTGTLPAWISSIKEEDIMQFNKSACGLYWWLLKATKGSITFDDNEDQNQKICLPYKKEEIDQLKIANLHWIREQGHEGKLKIDNKIIFSLKL